MCEYMCRQQSVLFWNTFPDAAVPSKLSQKEQIVLGRTLVYCVLILCKTSGFRKLQCIKLKEALKFLKIIWVYKYELLRYTHNYMYIWMYVCMHLWEYNEIIWFDMQVLHL